MVFVWATASYNLVEISHAVISFTATSFLSLVNSLKRALNLQETCRVGFRVVTCYNQ